VAIIERNFGGINSWGEVKKIVADDAQESDYFGYSVSVAGDVAIVGATGEDTAASGAGAAYIFERNFCGTNLWNQVEKLVASDAQASDHFGWSVAVAGDIAVVGAAYEDSGGNNSGAAYVFERNANGAYVFERNANGGTNNWGQVKKLVPHDSQENGYFGYSVAVAGDVIIVGAYGKSSYTGAAYVFERNANGGINNWGEVRKLTASDAQANSYFGWSVATAGDNIIVGKCDEDIGAAYIFNRDAGGINLWNEVKKIQSSELISNSYFGNSVAMASDVAIIGSYLENSVSRTGAAYIFEYLKIMPPTVSNNGGANGITDSSAILRGEITNTGGENPATTIFWGNNDAGTSTGNWNFSINMGIQTGSFFSAVNNLQPNTKYYYRCYATNSAGPVWANETTSFTTFDFPFLDITNENAFVTYDVKTFTIAGTNNANVVGEISWTNSLSGGSGSIQVSGVGFQVSGINLNVGVNTITVSGTNVFGTVTNDTIIITRGGAGTGLPFVDITNENKTVTYDVATYTIAGTNNVNVVGEISWTNPATGGSGTIQVSGVWFQVSEINLSVGENVITVSGTNVFGTATNDTIIITRGDAGTGQPFVDITNENKTVTYDVKTYTIAGTNNSAVVGGISWTNALTEARQLPAGEPEQDSLLLT